jgi:hypothetical protein
MSRYIKEAKPEKLASQAAAEGKKVRFGENNGYAGGNRI